MSTHPQKKKKKSGIVVLIILACLAILVFAGYWYIYRLTGKTNFDNSSDYMIQTNEEVQALPKKGYRNIVLFGVDSRSNSLTSGTRSDTIVIASINNKTKNVKLCSVYRDTYVNVPGHNYTKLNHAYSYGGYALALSTLNTNFDLNLKEYVTVNFSAVTKVIDRLGGITLDIDTSELKWLNGYIREINRVNGTNVSGLTSAGTQVVNGTQALAYARIRYTTGGDYKRTERQRIVIDKTFSKAKASSISTVLSIVNELLPQISTNIKTSDILLLAKDILSYNIVDSTGFPFEKKAATYNRVSYVFPIDALTNITQLHEFLYNRTSYEPSTTVQNYANHITSIGY